MTRNRAHAERQGRRAEWLAALWLQLRGFRILTRRFKAGGGEIDIAARRGDLLVFVEVKARSSLDAAILAVTRPARRRIESAGRSFVSKRPHLAGLGVRYDIIAVAGLLVRHMPGAWRAGES